MAEKVIMTVKLMNIQNSDDTNNSVGVGDRDKNEDVSSEEDQETSGDVGNDSRKTFTGDGRESDHDGKVNEHSEQDDTNNSVGVGDRDKNEDVSSEEMFFLIKRQVAMLEMIQEKHLRVMAEKVIMTVKLMNIQNRMIQTTV